MRSVDVCVGATGSRLQLGRLFYQGCLRLRLVRIVAPAWWNGDLRSLLIERCPKLHGIEIAISSKVAWPTLTASCGSVLTA